MSYRKRYANAIYDQINVTSLVDTLFFLLIIFMLTAPLLENAVDINPPVMSASEINPKDNAQTVNVQKDGTILLHGKTVSLEQLQQELYRIRQNHPDTEIFLRGDKDLRYGDIMNILKLIKSLDFKNIQLVTEEEQK